MARAARLASSSILLATLAALCVSAMPPSAVQAAGLKISNSQMEPIAWPELVGWADDDHLAGFKTFMESCKAILPRKNPGREAGPMFTALQQVCRTRESR